MAQLMPLPLTVSCFSIIQIGFTFLVPAESGSPGKRAVKRVCVCVCVCACACVCVCVLGSANKTSVLPAAVIQVGQVRQWPRTHEPYGADRRHQSYFFRIQSAVQFKLKLTQTKCDTIRHAMLF